MERKVNKFYVVTKNLVFVFMIILVNIECIWMLFLVNMLNSIFPSMIEEDIEKANVKCNYWGAVLPTMEMTLQDVKNWSEHKDLYGSPIK